MLFNKHSIIIQYSALQNMLQNKRLIGFSLLIIIVLVSVITLVVFATSNSPKLVGTVTEVNYRPNRDEDGHYDFTIRKSDGSTVAINATGFMNQPEPLPEDTECMDIPMLTEGQSVTFKLPRAKSADYDFTSCHPAGEHGYYFTALN